MSTITAPSVNGEALEEEFEGLFRDHHHLIYRTAYSVTGSRQDAEDVLQTLFVKLIERGLPDGNTGNLKGYLYRATVNIALNMVRSRKRENLTGEAEGLQTPAPSEEVTPDRDIQRALLDAFAQLRPRAVEILILHYEHNYSDAQIAKMLGTSRGVIAVTLYRTRARLKRLMFRAASGGNK
jgi:RNA polymerase sigma-70 factor, ECF subfamily